MAKKAKSAPAPMPTQNYMYLGPTIRGLINYSDIITDLRNIAPAISKYPEIRRFVVPTSEIQATKDKIKNGYLGVIYKQLVKKIGG